MSIKKLGKWVLLGVGVGTVLGFADHWAHKRYTEKISFDQRLRPRSAAIAQKPHQSLTVRLRNIDDLPIDANEEMRLEISIRSNRPLDAAAQLRWRLPSGVQLVSGSSLDENIELVAGEEWVREVSVRGISTDTEAVVKAEVSGTVDGTRVGSDGFFASHPVQTDLSRKAIPAKPSDPFFSKASRSPEAAKPRLPAGIQF